MEQDRTRRKHVFVDEEMKDPVMIKKLLETMGRGDAAGWCNTVAELQGLFTGKLHGMLMGTTPLLFDFNFYGPLSGFKIPK